MKLKIEMDFDDITPEKYEEYISQFDKVRSLIAKLRPKGTSESGRVLEIVKDEIMLWLKRYKRPRKTEELMHWLKDQLGLPGNKIDRAIQDLKREGEIYEPKEGYIKQI